MKRAAAVPIGVVKGAPPAAVVDAMAAISR
jgi:hypothetical protein